MARKRVERNISFDDVRKVYYVSMDLGKNSEGKRVKQYRTFPNLTSARTGLREFYADRDKLLHPPKQEQTLRQWLDYWMENIIRPNWAETTVYAYQKIIDNHLDPLLGAVPLSKLSPKQIQEYYQTMTRTEGLSSNTIRRHHDLLSAALRMAVRQDMLRVNPMERVEPPRPKLHEASYYTQENLKVLYQLVEGHWLEMVVKVTAGLGLRREEICGLKWESVDFQRRVVHIKEARTAYGATVVQKETKNRSSMRTLFMPDELYELLRREKARQEQERAIRGGDYAASGHVVLDREGLPYSPNALSLAFTRFVRKNHLPRLTLHGLRHTFATIASAQGVPLFDIGKAMGHSTPATTGRIYTHLVDRTHEETLLLVSAALK